MGFLKTLAGWASHAWGAITGAAGNPLDALTKLWHYITSVHGVLSWLAGNPVLRFFTTALQYFTTVGLALIVIRDVLRRLAAWIWAHEVRPVRDQLQRKITVLAAWARAEFAVTWAEMRRLYAASLAYTRQQVGIERAQRMKAVRIEHAAMLAGDKATLATVQKEAVSAYDAGVHARVGVAGQLLDDLVTRTPLIKDLVNAVIDGALKLADVEDPVLGFLLTKLVNEIVAKVGVDRLAAEAAQSLLGPIIGGKRPAGLHDVVGDLDARLSAMEKQWAEFMKDGGPEVEQAGKEWKSLTGLAVDAGLLAFVGLAVAEPDAWAKGISDTVGVAGNAALSAAVSLIGRL